MYPLKEKALGIARALRAAGVTVWVDTEQLAAAAADAPLSDALRLAIVNSRIALLCVSDVYARSKNCRVEAEFAENRGKTFVVANVGGAGYDPARFADADTANVGWLGSLIHGRFWSDARDAGSAASAAGHAQACLGR